MGTLSLNDYVDVRIWAPWGDIAGRWYGNRSERPILAIHGWLDNLGTFDTLIPLLPDYLGVLCIEMPGHGRSARLPPGMVYHVDSYIHIVARVMKEYKWKKVSLMGHSMGGAISYVFTSIAPHMVDMIISLDIMLPHLPASFGVGVMNEWWEKHLVAEERSEEAAFKEPPSQTLAQLRNVVTNGTYNSVPPEFAHHLLYRSVAKSQLYPEKLYFSRDARVKFYVPFPMNLDLGAEMARRIINKPYIIIKGAESNEINPIHDEVISILRAQNPHFELHEVPGLHHVHLVNAEECAKYIVPFIRRHRPPPLTSWSLPGEEAALTKREHRKAQESFFARKLKRLAKL